MTDWESIARAHGPMAFETAWRILGHVQDAEDATQAALLDALRLHFHDQGGIENWGGMIRRLATRRALDRLRQRRRRAGDAQATDDLPARGADQPEQVAAARELAARLRAALAELPDRQATAFALRYFGELSNPQIADALHVSDHAVAVALSKARTTLAQLLGVTGARGATAQPESTTTEALP